MSVAEAATATRAGERPAVTLDGLTKHFDSVVALDGVSATVGRGRFLVLLGPSGSGKSTLIRCLAGIERPSGGTIRLGDDVVADDRRSLPPERRDLAMVFQDFALWPHMTVTENVSFPLRRRRISGSDAGARVRAMLHRVGLVHHSERYPHELSGGEQQRVALARALVGHPALALFDEPLSSLDENLRERLRIEIGTLVREQGATAVYITHDQREAFALGDEIGVLEHGRLVQLGTPERVYDAPVSPFVARFTGLSGTLSGRLLGTAGEVGEPVRVALPTSAPDRTIHLTATAMTPLGNGAAVQVMLRPTAVRIVAADADDAQLRAVVRDAAFVGRGYSCVLELGEGLELTAVFSRRRPARAETVGVRFDPSRSLVFADDASVQLPPLAAEALPASPRPGAADDPILDGSKMSVFDDEWN